MTADHYIHTQNKGAIRAQSLKVGDEVITRKGECAVVTRIVQANGIGNASDANADSSGNGFGPAEGLYCPLTLSGTVVVDDIVCSCYVLPTAEALNRADGALSLPAMLGVEESLNGVIHLAWAPLRYYQYVVHYLVYDDLKNQDARAFLELQSAADVRVLEGDKTEVEETTTSAAAEGACKNDGKVIKIARHQTIEKHYLADDATKSLQAVHPFARRVLDAQSSVAFGVATAVNVFGVYGAAAGTVLGTVGAIGAGPMGAVTM